MKNGEYILVVAPEGWEGKKYRGRYCYEHQLIYWENTGKTPGPGELIHHIDRDKHNNNFENLILYSVSQHNKEHKSTGRTMANLMCKFCGVSFDRESRLVKPGQENFFCCRSHQVKQQHIDARYYNGNRNAC